MIKWNDFNTLDPSTVVENPQWRSMKRQTPSANGTRSHPSPATAPSPRPSPVPARAVPCAQVPRKKRSDAVKNAVVIMNTFGEIERKAAGLIEFTPEDMLEIADLYARSRAELATMFEYLPPQEQERYMFYANALRAYEQNLAAEPDVDV